MKLSSVIISMALIFVCVQGECNNGCNKNGRCSNHPAQYESASTTVSSITVPTSFESNHGFDTSIEKKDSCTCFTRKVGDRLEYAYTGADCSLMTCPHGQSWDAGLISVTKNNQADTPASVATATHDAFSECSDRGICDRSTGVCACLKGYEGKACQRTTCPNSCSNHGVCKTIHEIAKLNSENDAWDTLDGFERSSIQYNNAWDANKIRACECDSGWRGPDCSIKECPSEADPLDGEGSESGRECSGRGLCVAGECKCFTGYFGTACNTQRANAVQ